MPKKSKKKKILAELRRKLRSLPTHSDIVKSQNNENPSTKSFFGKTDFVFNKHLVIRQKNTTLLTDYSFVKGDLVKITIFTILALISQFMLYFLLNRG